MKKFISDTIVAPATSYGQGAIAIIRTSGKESIPIVNKVFKGKDLQEQQPNTIHFGTITDGEEIIDEVLISIFRAPNSFTKEDSIEISCHGSKYIVEKIIQLLIDNGARMADPGEFSKRAFLNGRYDLSQAESIADLIASNSKLSHKIALSNMRGGISSKIKIFRDKLLSFISLLELELDFSEEDLEFVNRNYLTNEITELINRLSNLLEGFKLNNAIKIGIPIVIAGKPNSGKSTLLNVILEEERSIVSNIPGTTRDFIEDQINIHGINFRITDTAGIRDTDDIIEKLGVEMTFLKIKKAYLVLYLIDLENASPKQIEQEINELKLQKVPFLIVGNKLDNCDFEIKKYLESLENTILISAKNNINIEELKNAIIKKIKVKDDYDSNTMISNIRHYESLIQSKKYLENALNGLNNQITTELIVSDIRSVLNCFGEITGEITTDDILDNIFSKFCIGK